MDKSTDNITNISFNNDDTKTKMTDSIRMILRYWYAKCKVFYKCHKESCVYYDKVNKYLGIPAVVVGVFNTTTIFTNYLTPNQALTLVIGSASFISTILTIMQNYFDLSKISNTHGKLANGYNKITHIIEKILMFDKLSNTNEIQSNLINNILNQMETLQQDSPSIPDDIWNKHKKELKNMVSVIINNKGIINDFSSFLTKSDTSHEDEKNTPKSNNSNNEGESREVIKGNDNKVDEIKSDKGDKGDKVDKNKKKNNEIVIVYDNSS
jgi:hypothetical protein